MKDFKFTKEEIIFLKDIKRKGTISNKQALTVESIFQRMDSNYTLSCNSCSSVIAKETKKLIDLSERIAESDKVTVDLNSMKMHEIKSLVLSETGTKLTTVGRTKVSVIKEANKLLNK